jgi:ribonuclease P protein component
MATFSDNDGFKLSKKERVSGKLRIANLYNKSQIKFPEYPLFIAVKAFSSENSKPSIALLTVVSSKKFKNAVDRNKIKRLLREVFRLNKHKFSSLLKTHHLDADISLGYMASSILTYEKLNTAINKIIPKLHAELEKNTG